MSWLVSAKQYIPAVIGEPFGGGYFAGYISHTANGVPTHALIVAPRATGASGNGYPLSADLQWKTDTTATTGTTSVFDGAANTAAMVTAGIADHPAAQFCENLSIGGFTDWYLPALYELEIAYFNLKPSTAANNTSFGTNIYAVPQRNGNYSAAYPLQTAITAFNTSAEGFLALVHWTSTESPASNRAWVMNLGNGLQDTASGTKTALSRARAFRRIAL